MQDTFYQAADAGLSLSGIGCRRHSIRQPMQESLYQKADEESLDQTPDAGDTLSDRRCKTLSIRHRMQDSL